jgi:glycerol-3-phosphate O-acyltransferase
MKYLGQMMARGHSIEYFIEGGRSRTGRLLQPKAGMLSMTVRSYLREPTRPLVFVPIYFGYERLVEGRTYIGELSGRPKEKESVLSLLKAVPALRSRFGKVYVSFGQPLPLDPLIQKHAPGWSREPSGSEDRPEWLSPLVRELSTGIMTRINAAACVSPSTWSGWCCSPRRARAWARPTSRGSSSCTRRCCDRRRTRRTCTSRASTARR